jgi:translation initiation factor 2B subunit (eIF-2B alpha/beta/delta family)
MSMVNAALKERLQELRDDRSHGASWLARRALEALLEALDAGDDPVATARALAAARPSMGAIAGAVGRVIAAGHTPNQTIAEAQALLGSRDRAARTIAVLLRPSMTGVVLTHSASATVREACLYTPPERLICTTSDPGGEGARLAAELRAEGLDVTLVDDAGATEALRGAQLLLLGADTIFRSGAFVNKVGTLALAREASRLGIPVIVASETFKLAPCDPQPPQEASFELIPAELVDMVVTEEGAVAAADVPSLIDRTPFLRQGYALLHGQSRLRPEPSPT